MIQRFQTLELVEMSMRLPLSLGVNKLDILEFGDQHKSSLEQIVISASQKSLHPTSRRGVGCTAPMQLAGTTSQIATVTMQPSAQAYMHVSRYGNASVFNDLYIIVRIGMFRPRNP